MSCRRFGLCFLRCGENISGVDHPQEWGDHYRGTCIGECRRAWMPPVLSYGGRFLSSRKAYSITAEAALKADLSLGSGAVPLLAHMIASGSKQSSDSAGRRGSHPAHKKGH